MSSEFEKQDCSNPTNTKELSFGYKIPEQKDTPASPAKPRTYFPKSEEKKRQNSPNKRPVKCTYIQQKGKGYSTALASQNFQYLRSFDMLSSEFNPVSTQGEQEEIYHYKNQVEAFQQ